MRDDWPKRRTSHSWSSRGLFGAKGCPFSVEPCALAKSETCKVPTPKAAHEVSDMHDFVKKI